MSLDVNSKLTKVANTNFNKFGLSIENHMPMKLISSSVLISAFLFFHVQSVHSQIGTKITDNSISSQYQDIIQKSKSNDQGFKVINPARLSTFQKNFTDTIRQAKKKLAEVQNKINQQNKSLASLKANLESEKKNLNESKSQVDEINLFGFGVNKSRYNWLMWGLVIGLGAALAFIIFRSTSSRREAKYRIKLFDELSGEFQTYKVKANEKEKKLARELQTERNRVDELLKR